MPRKFAAPLISVLLALLLLNACSSEKPTRSLTGRYVVVAPKASFYKYGPAQSFGPDFQLPKGQKLTKLDHSYGFSHVMTDDGTTGYVANEDIRPAPPEPVAALSPGAFPSVAATSKSKKRNRPPPPPPSSVFDVNDVPLPSADSTPAPNKLKFRY
jgi:hypothetical protein